MTWMPSLSPAATSPADVARIGLARPVLAVCGGQGHLTPPGEALTIYRDVLSRTGIGLARDGVAEGGDDAFVRGCPELVASWVTAVTSGRAPAPSPDPAQAQVLPSPVIRSAASVGSSRT